MFRKTRGAGLDKSLEVRKSIPILAIIPNTPECEKPLTEGKAMAEFHPDEGEPFRLLADPYVCPVLGFARGIEIEKAVGAGRID